MAKTKIWYAAPREDGTVRDLQIRQMDTQHLQHCLSKIDRSTRLEKIGGQWILLRWRGRYRKAIQAELLRRADQGPWPTPPSWAVAADTLRYIMVGMERNNANGPARQADVDSRLTIRRPVRAG